MDLRSESLTAAAAKVGPILQLSKAHVRNQANEHVTLHKTRLEGVDDIKEVFVCPPLTRRRMATIATSPTESPNSDSDTQLEDILKTKGNFAILVL